MPADLRPASSSASTGPRGLARNTSAVAERHRLRGLWPLVGGFGPLTTLFPRQSSGRQKAASANAEANLRQHDVNVVCLERIYCRTETEQGVGNAVWLATLGCVNSHPQEKRQSQFWLYY